MHTKRIVEIEIEKELQRLPQYTFSLKDAFQAHQGNEGITKMPGKGKKLTKRPKVTRVMSSGIPARTDRCHVATLRHQTGCKQSQAAINLPAMKCNAMHATLQNNATDISARPFYAETLAQMYKKRTEIINNILCKPIFHWRQLKT
jgi:hypothetical protein